MNTHYILDPRGEPTAVSDLMTWAQWFESSSKARIVAQEYIGERMVSTVFLGLDYRFSGYGPPILWETMVFNKRRDCLYVERCPGSREQAEAMHANTVRAQGNLAKVKALKTGKSNRSKAKEV